MTKPANLITPLEDLQTLAQTYFKPDLHPPRRVNDPVPPSLAASKLPPPCAELDERPAWRYRRFRLWRDAVVPLRVAVVDRNRRVHLRRYQSFAIPATPTLTRGSFAVRWIPPPTPHPSRPASPAEDGVIPSQDVPPAQIAVPQAPIPLRGQSHLPTGQPTPPKLSKAERKARRLRLLQFQYALDQEHERRFRQAMRSLVPDLVEFEAASLTRDVPNGPLQWREEVDLDMVMTRIQFFRDIRKKSNNVYHYVDPAICTPVPRRSEVHQAVKDQEQERKDRKAKKKGQQEQRQATAVSPQATSSPAPPVSSPLSDQEQVVVPSSEETSATAPKRPKAKPKTSSERPRSKRKTQASEASGDLTDGTTASEGSIRTPTSSQRGKLPASKSAPVIVTQGSVESKDNTSSAGSSDGRTRREGKHRKHRLVRLHTTPPAVDPSVTPTTGFVTDPVTPLNTGDLQVMDEEQLLKDLQALLSKLSTKPADTPPTTDDQTSPSSIEDPSRRLAPLTQVRGPGEDASSRGTERRPRGRLIIIRSNSDKRVHRARNDALPPISSERIARLADLQETVEVPITPAAVSVAPPPVRRSPPRPAPSSPPKADTSARSAGGRLPRSSDSITASTRKSSTPVFGELNMDEDTAAPFGAASRASSISPTEAGWISESQGDSNWSDSLGGSVLDVSIQDTAEFEEGSIDTAVPVMRHKEVDSAM